MPNYKFTVEEKVAMVRQHYEGLSYRRISDHFAATHADRPIPTHAAIRKIVLRFEKTGTVDGHLLKVTQPKKKLPLETKLAICLAAEEDPAKPASKIAQEIGVSKSSVRNVLREAKCQAQKNKAQQEPDYEETQKKGCYTANNAQQV